MSRLRRHWRLKKSQKGVALFYFIMVLGVLLGFMMLVVNTGMIVYQKIRLQTAVDLASYAGASVQASYLGNSASGKDSIRGINFEIQKRYAQLTEDLQKLNLTPAPWYGLVPVDIQGPAGMAACMAACGAANIINAQLRASTYQAAARDLEPLRLKASRILSQLSKASKGAAEATIRLNIPELSVENSGVAGILSETTDKVEEVVQSNKQVDAGNILRKKKNAVLSFSSAKGMYLASVVATVPHSFVYYGPLCSSQRNSTAYPFTPSLWYCHVNGQGAGGQMLGYVSAFAAFTRSFTPPATSGNIGNISSISDQKANAIRIHFIQNENKPNPFFVSAAEWYPENGSFMNMENSLGATGSLFPKQTRLVAVSAAEPFGGSLIGASAPNFGARLQSIRKLLLDPRMNSVKGDFGGLYDYMESLSPMDQNGRPMEKPEQVIRRFLH